MKIELLDEVDSTVDYVRRYLNGGEDVIVCAKRQTGGKGTKGRSFLSMEGGVYFTSLRFLSQFPGSDAFHLMQHAAVAVCRTVESYGVKAVIKWPNDVFVNGKKIAGILIENVFSGNSIQSSIVGIGLNVTNDLSGLEGVAVNLSEAAGRILAVEEVRDRLIENFCKTELIRSEEAYGQRLLLGRLKVVEGEDVYFANARRVLPDGRLEVERDGVVRRLSAAEVSIR